MNVAETTWRMYPTSRRAHAFSGPNAKLSVCGKVPLDATRLAREGEILNPCRFCVRAVAQQERLWQAIVAAGKRIP